MRWSIVTPFVSALAAMTSLASAERILQSKSLSSCQEESDFSAQLFHVQYTPGNNSASVNMAVTSSVQGYVVFDITLTAYGYKIINEKVKPCETEELKGLCPMKTGSNEYTFPLNVPDGAGDMIPGIAYTIPDLDAKAKVFVNMTDTGKSVACLEADFSNSKTVDLIGVKWATAIIAGLALMSSAVISGLGHSNAAAHIAANSLSLFGFFQSQAIIGLTAVPLPPIVRAWTQNFQWSMGIIRVQFMQTIFTWYQRATGGDPAIIFDSLRTHSVQVEKRDIGMLDEGISLFKRSAAMLPRAAESISSNISKRSNIELSNGSYLVYGIQRVAFMMGIETTDLFMTGLTFFLLFVVFTIMAVAAFKGILELAAKKGWLKSDKFLDFRNGWITVLKGILFRCTLIGFPQMTILSLWEFTQVDSPALVVLAVFMLLSMCATLGWGCYKVVSIARRSVAMHRNPAYILFSDPQSLNKWGFLYIQFRASAYYFIIPMLVYTFIKSMFVALAQKSGIAQAVGFIILEAAALIGASVLRPWMDKSTNSFNIAICVVNFLNSICLLIFTNVFGAPGLAMGATGIILFVLNASFALILLLMVIISTTFIFFRKNPDAKYHVMADDRTSFMKSQTQLHATTELDALAATARGDKGGYKSQLDLDDDNESLSSDSMRRRAGANGPPHSPINPGMPLFPANRPESPFRSQSPNPFKDSVTSLHSPPNRGQNASPAAYRGQNPSSPWQRGAGYD